MLNIIVLRTPGKNPSPPLMHPGVNSDLLVTPFMLPVWLTTCRRLSFGLKNLVLFAVIYFRLLPADWAELVPPKHLMKALGLWQQILLPLVTWILIFGEGMFIALDCIRLLGRRATNIDVLARLQSRPRPTFSEWQKLKTLGLTVLLVAQFMWTWEQFSAPPSGLQISRPFKLQCSWLISFIGPLLSSVGLTWWVSCTQRLNSYPPKWLVLLTWTTMPASRFLNMWGGVKKQAGLTLCRLATTARGFLG